MDTKHKTYSFLDGLTVGVLSTVDDKNQPWGAAIYYVTDEQLNFYFLTLTNSRKYKNISHNPSVALTVADNFQQTTVQVTGVANEVEAGDEHDAAFSKLAAVHPPGQFAWVPPVSKMHDGTKVLMKLTPTAVHYTRFKSSEQGEIESIDALQAHD